MALKLSSLAFSHNGPIPQKHTCEGADEPPPLQWTGVPPDTQSLALIVDDPDAPDPKAPERTFVHWVLYNIPPALASLTQDGPPLPADIRRGTNDAKTAAYYGPCPPIGRHRYFFKLYALDTVLDDLGEPTKGKLERAMQDHILEQTELIGTYEKSAK